MTRPAPPRLPGEPADLDWTRHRTPNGRLIAESSPRQPIQYQLLAGGGQRWIRRIDRTGPDPVTVETRPGRARTVTDLWNNLRTAANPPRDNDAWTPEKTLNS